MESVKEKAFVFDTMEEDITASTSTPDEAARARKILLEAAEQTRKKEIKITRKVEPFKKLLTLIRLRFRYGVHWKKPFYPIRLLRNEIVGKFYDMFGIKKYVLRGIEFAVTFRCNFSCNHCLCARITDYSRRELEPEDYRRVVKEAMALGATTFGLEGGEPFVKKGWDKIIEAWQPHYNHIIVSTNGYLFDEKIARRCAELGVDTVNFSLDSGIAEIHDAFRKKKGAFERVMNGIRLCKIYGIKVIINNVTHKGNLYTDGYRELLEFAERERIMINTLLAKGVGNFKDKDAMLDEDDLKAYEKIIAPYNWVQRHLNFNYGKQFGCPGTKEMINMTPYGDVMNCANMHIYFGNVMEEPLAVVRERTLANSPFGRYHECFLAVDRDFMNVYYPLLERKGHMSLDEFKTALKTYEKEHGKVLYPELCTTAGCTGCA